MGTESAQRCDLRPTSSFISPGRPRPRRLTISTQGTRWVPPPFLKPFAIWTPLLWSSLPSSSAVYGAAIGAAGHRGGSAASADSIWCALARHGDGRPKVRTRLQTPSHMQPRLQPDWPRSPEHAPACGSVRRRDRPHRTIGIEGSNPNLKPGIVARLHGCARCGPRVCPARQARPPWLFVQRMLGSRVVIGILPASPAQGGSRADPGGIRSI